MGEETPDTRHQTRRAEAHKGRSAKLSKKSRTEGHQLDAVKHLRNLFEATTE
jgi:hypothetical protein